MKDAQEYINEAGLSRIHGKIDNHSAGAITAFRGEFSRSENKNRNKEILAYLLKKGYSVVKVKGSYIEQYGTDNAKEVGEESWLVANTNVEGDDGGELERDLIRLGKKYDQDSILSIQAGGEKAELIGTSRRDDAFPSYGRRETVGKLKLGGADGPFFSRVRGRKFAFEGLEFIPDLEPHTINGKLALQRMGERIERELNEQEE